MFTRPVAIIALVAVLVQLSFPIVGSPVVNAVASTINAIPDSAGQAEITVSYPAGWNMIAASSTIRVDRDLYAYNSETGKYVIADSPVPGDGYWAYFTQPATLSMKMRSADSHTVNLAPGWNMVGNPFDANAVLPSNQSAYVYEPVVNNYSAAGIIEKGRGAWVYTRLEGPITLTREQPRQVIEPISTPDSGNTDSDIDNGANTDNGTSSDSEPANGGTTGSTNPGTDESSLYSGRMVNASAYGAKGDGVTNDTTAIQKAINALQSGDTLVLDSTYLVGALSIQGRTTIRIDGNNTGVLKLASGTTTMLDIDKSSNLEFKGLTFDGNGGGTRFLDIQSTNNVAVKNSVFKNLGAGSNNVGAMYIAPGSRDIIVQGSVFKDITSTGVTRAIWISNYRDNSNYASNINVTGNTFSNIQPAQDGDAVVFDQLGQNAESVVRDNVFKNVHKRAVKVMADGVTVENNQINRDNIGQGFGAMSGYGSNITFNGNKVYATGNANYYYIIDVTGSNVTVTNNYLENSVSANNGGTFGVSIYKSSYIGGLPYKNINISDNTIKNVEHAVSTYGETPVDSMVINRNRLDSISGYGLYVRSQISNLTLKDNIVTARSGLFSFTNGLPSVFTKSGNMNNGVAVP